MPFHLVPRRHYHAVRPSGAAVLDSSHAHPVKGTVITMLQIKELHLQRERHLCAHGAILVVAVAARPVGDAQAVRRDLAILMAGSNGPPSVRWWRE